MRPGAKRSGYMQVVQARGGTAERRLASLLQALPFLVAVPFALFVGTAILQRVSIAEVVYPGLSFLLAASSWAFYRSVILETLNTPEVIRGMLEANRYSPAKRAYLIEVARYRETRDVAESAAKDSRWGQGCGWIYVGSCFASFIVPFALFPSLGASGSFLFIAADMSLAVACLSVHRRQLTEQALEAERRGFHLKELSLELRRESTQVQRRR